MTAPISLRCVVMGCLIAVGFCFSTSAKAESLDSDPHGCVYPNGDIYEFRLFVSGSGGWLPENVTVFFNGEHVKLDQDPAQFESYLSSTGTSDSQEPQIEWIQDTEKSLVTVKALARDWPSDVTITVQQSPPKGAAGATAAATPKFECRIMFARISPDGARAVSAIVLATIIGILWVLTAKIGKYEVAGVQYGGWSQWLIDPSTDSYSLSKFQFYVWTAVAVFGYAFLTICRSLVQGTFEFADLPQGLPGIVAISGGTAVFASAVTSSIGNMGSGNVQPSRADLITSGGVVVSERVQYFVWTIVGAGAFLYNVWNRDPSTISSLPVVPQQFLQIMGISAAGYLGGKLARGQGPVINQVIVARKPQSAMDYTVTLQLMGTGLSALASYQIQAMNDATPHDVAVSPPPAGGSNPEITAKQADYEKTKFATSLKVTLQWAPETKINDLLSGKDPVTLIMYNPDGECSKVQFNPS